MFIDPNPTRVDNPVITDKDFKAYKRAQSAPPAASALPSVTEIEVAALKGIDAVEQVADPLNRFNAARVSVKLAAWVARKIR